MKTVNNGLAQNECVNQRDKLCRGFARQTLVATIVVALMLLPMTANAQDAKSQLAWKVGAATVKITPTKPIRMSGYRSRTEPAEGTEQELYAKAIAIEDKAGNRVVFVTTDLIGILAELRTHVEGEAKSKWKLPAHALLMNSSHTHCGPAYGRDDDDTKAYFAVLKGKIVSAIGQAIDALEPASLSYSHAKCSVAMNRRTPTATGFLNHPNPKGLVDHSVPVLSARDAAGKLKTVVFGYACHNTTMGFRRWLGDYAGYAQEHFEKDNPGVTALFMMGCGGDQNPYPRRELRYASSHGRSLATAVEAALEFTQSRRRHQRLVTGNLSSALETVDLEFETADRPDFAYPVQVIRFGNDLMLIALGNEVVVDYSLRLKSELTREEGPAIWVAGYSNVYDGYIPSRRVLLEGGYEARSRPWKPSLEERIIKKVHELVVKTKQPQAQ
jgi:hypothetical protein